MMNMKLYRRTVSRFLSKRMWLVFLLIFTAINLIPLMAQEIEQPIELESTVLTRGLKIRDQRGEQILLYKESHALLIGVSEYTNGWPRLPGVKSDVQEVKTALETQGFNVLVAMNLDRNTLERTLNSFITQYGHKPENRLLFYFAGHGHTMRLAYGGEMGYIVPADAPLPENDEIEFLAAAMDMQMIEVYARRIQAKHALFLFDSCFSGAIFTISRAVPESISSKTASAVRQFITSGSANETVPDESVFRQQFIAALAGEGDRNNDGYVTGSELGIYLENTVINYTRGSQHPQYGKIRDRYLDKGDFVFKLPEKQEKPTPTPLIPPDVTGSYGDIEDQLKWQDYLDKMEEAFVMFHRHEDLDVSTEKKIAAWKRFIKDFSADNPNSTRDDEFRNAAQERIAFWQKSLFATPIPISQPPTPKPTPMSTATSQPPTPIPTATPEPIFRIDSIVIKDHKNKAIHPVNGIYTIKVDKTVMITVDVTIPRNHTIAYTWETGHGKLSSKKKNTAKYKAKKTESDFVIIRIENKNMGETLAKPINITVVR